MSSLNLALLIQAALWVSVSPQKFLSRQATAVPTNTVPTSTIEPDSPTSRMMLNEMAETFLKQIFQKYGNDGVMTFEAFEHLLENLGLGNMEISDHDLQDHFSEAGFEEFHESHDHKMSGSHEGHEGDHNHTEEHHGDHDHGDHDHEDHHKDSDHGNSDNGDHDHDDHHKDSEHGDHDHDDHHGNSEHGDHDHDDHHDNSDNEDHDHKDHHKDSDNGDHDHDDHHGNSDNGDHGHKDHHEDGDSENHGDHGDHDHGDHDHEDHHEDHDPVHQPTKDHLHRRRSHNTTRSPSQNDTSLDPDDSQRLKRRVPTEELSIKKCLSAREILMNYNLQLEGGISMDDFVNLCPAIVFQIDEHMCNHGYMKSECGNNDDHHDHHGHHHDHDHDHDGNETMHHQKVEPLSHRPWWQFWKIPWKVWLAALCAVTIISLVGLFSVAMVPIMQKVFFNQLIQFLVALAIGSLTGDALLHLIPHAIAGGHGGHEEEGHEPSHDLNHDHGEKSSHSHAEAVWKCMVALGGIYLFFVMERLMGMVTEWKRAKKKKREVAELLEMSTTSFNNVGVGEKLSKHNDKYASCGNFLFVHSSKDVCRLAEEAHEELEQIKECEEERKHLNASDLDQHSEGHGHGHAHGHGHSHDVPESISSVAWMVIMGDGLHNFTDGLAIGAGFANSLSGGLSTSLAVFCHELPHELGDFAVLLRAGMSVKQALFYNIVSSVLCYMGMLIGVILGNLSQASLWIFAMTGGMFIYISLVDMMPELTSSRSGQLKQCWRNLLLQILGISVGVSIMLVIALYEDRIQVNIGD